MNHILTLEGADLAYLHEVVFPSIASRNSILLLGAGSSVTDKQKFLSKEIIKLYSSKKGISLDTDDIIDFVDTLSSNENFSRDDFDEFVDELLRTLKVSESHRIIASMSWREIITTNQDLLIERAFDDVLGTANENLRLEPVRALSAYDRRVANDEVKYVKLNGCISDKRRYPLVYSSKDFERSTKFYRRVLQSLQDLSPKISFLSIGFSYSDHFARSLLKQFDKYKYRNRRWILSVDPFVEDDRLPYFSENQICIIRLSADAFLTEYKRWEAASHAYIATRRDIQYTDREHRKVQVPNAVKVRVGTDLIQLSEVASSHVVSAESFYKGEEPTFAVIRKDLDVVKRELLSKVVSVIEGLLAEPSSLVPILFLVGSYGTGKTTFCYRTTYELIHDAKFDALGFEVVDADKLRASDLELVFSSTKASNIILLFNGIEVDSTFKALNDFRTKLSAQQFQNFKVMILASIRENILNKYQTRHSYPNTTELNIDQPFTEAEAADLVEKLSSANILHYRDARQRAKLVRQVIDDYEGDTLVALISLVAGSTHNQIVRDAYSQLTPLAQNALLYTSLLYRFNIRMPASLLRSLTGKTWDHFTRDVLEYDSKGILIQEVITAVGTEPDIYIRTKHPVIADALVKLLFPSEDLRYEKYEHLARHLTPSFHSSKLVVDLLKALRDTEDLTEEKISMLFDSCSQIFEDDPHFNLHYAINLQHRGNDEALKKGIRRLQHSESLTESRNHYLLHRRAVLNFRLAQIVGARERELNHAYQYIDEARSLFEVKLIVDPFSSFSYIEFIRFEMWYLSTVTLSDEEKLRQRIKLEELLDKAEKSLTENAHIIVSLRADYLRIIGNRTDEERREYVRYLEEAAEEPTKKPYALILLFYHFESLHEHDRCLPIIQELESFQHLDEVAKVLFRHYGRNLQNANNRVRFLEIINNHPVIEKKDPIRYHYYSYVVESYNRNFRFAYEHLAQLRRSLAHTNPELNETWKDENSENKMFEAIVVIYRNRRQVKILDLQRTIDLVAGDYSKLAENSRCYVYLHFFLTGIRAEIQPVEEPASA